MINNNKIKKYNICHKINNFSGIVTNDNNKTKLKNINIKLNSIKDKSKIKEKIKINLKKQAKSNNNYKNTSKFLNKNNSQTLKNIEKKIILLNKCYNNKNINKLNLKISKNNNKYLINNSQKLSFSNRLNKNSYDRRIRNINKTKLSSLKSYEKKLNKTVEKNCKNKNILSKLNFGKNNYIKVLENVKIIKNIIVKEKNLPKFNDCKTNINKSGVINSFSVNTHKGMIRNYNEDRVSILLNANKKYDNLIKKNINNCSIFSIFDGHGGIGCCNYLKENLHNIILKNIDFNNISKYLKNTFLDIDKTFCDNYIINNEIDYSGSCAILALIYDNKLVIANTGDSRCIISQNKGKQFKSLSKDHKPNNSSEFNRIIKNDGKIYQYHINIDTNETKVFSINNYKDIKTLNSLNNNIITRGPLRVNPGGLSVSRTFGDIESKLEQFGGKTNVITALPDIIQYEINTNDDFIILASDGVFDNLSNKEIIKIVWSTVDYYKFTYKNFSKLYDKLLNDIVNNILKLSLIKESKDNVTLLLINFKNLLN